MRLVTRAVIDFASGARRGLLSAACLLAGAVFAACGSDDGPAGPGPLPEEGWQQLGLSGAAVLSLHAREGVLYAGTDRGLFRRELEAEDTAWVRLGLRDRAVQALLVLEGQRMLAGVRISGAGADTVSLYRSRDGGVGWEAFQNGFGCGEGSNQVSSLARLGGDTLLAAGTGVRVWRSTDGGQSWTSASGEACLFGPGTHFLHVAPAAPNVVWSGGENAILQPFLLKSADRGGSWRTILPNLGGDNAHYTLVTHPEDADLVYTGTEGFLLRSRDGGGSWLAVLAPSRYPYFFGLELSHRFPERVFAAGAQNTTHPQPLVLYMSRDGGDSWEEERYPGATHGGVRSLLVAAISGRDVVFLGSEEGAFAYVVPE